MKQWTLLKIFSLSVILLVVLLGCGSDTPSDPDANAQATPLYIAWQRPQAPASADTFAQVSLTGILLLHQGTVNGVAFSSNGTRLASAGADNMTVVWNLASGEALSVRSDTDGRRVFFGPEDDTLITVNNNGVVYIWSINLAPPRELEQITSFAGHDTSAPIVAQSPDRSLLAFGTPDGAIRLWRVPAGEVVTDIQAHSGNIQQIVFSPDNNLMASMSSDAGIKIWSVSDGTLVYDINETGDIMLQAAFSPDSQRLATASATTIQVWDLQNGQLLYTITLAENAAAASLKFSPDGTLLAGCGQQPLVGVWDSQNGELMGGIPLPNNQRCRLVAFSPDSKLLLTLPAPGRDVYLWDIQLITDDVLPEEKQLRRRDRENMGLFPGRLFYSAAWSEDGRFIILVDELGPLHILSTAE